MMFIRGRLIVIQDVQDVRAIGQKVNEQGEQDGEGEEFHVREVSTLPHLQVP